MNIKKEKFNTILNSGNLTNFPDHIRFTKYYNF